MKVLYKFADLKDKGHVYNVGDNYPRAGYKPTKERVEELKGSDNKIGRPLIKEDPEKTEPKSEDAETKPTRSSKRKQDK